MIGTKPLQVQNEIEPAPNSNPPDGSFEAENDTSEQIENSLYENVWGEPQEKALRRYKLQRPYTETQLNDACFDLLGRVPEKLEAQVRADYDMLLPFAS